MILLNTIKAYELDWNQMTVEAFNEQKNEATMIFNLDITTEDKITNVIQYVVGRAIWAQKNFLSKVKITLSFDLRGQNIIVSRSKLFKDRMLELINNLDIDNQISIDFLR